MPKKAMVDSTMWLWIGLVITLLVFFFLFMFQQAGQRLGQSNIQIGNANTAGIEYNEIHDAEEKIIYAEEHDVVMKNERYL